MAEEEVKSLEIPVQELKREQCDSDEEWFFANYLKELIEHNVLLEAKKNFEPIILAYPVKHRYREIQKKKSKDLVKHLMHGHEYTPDFNIHFNPDFQDLFYSLLNNGEKYPKQDIPFLSFGPFIHGGIIEVKASFVQQDELRHTSIDLKWVFDRHQLFIQLVRVPDIFEKTFCPQVYIDSMVRKVNNSKTGAKKGDSRIKFKVLKINEYIEKISVFKPKQQKLEV